MLRIAFLTNEYPPHIYGGAGVHVDYLTRELIRLAPGSHTLHVLSFGNQREASGPLTITGIPAPAPFPCQDPRHAKLFAPLHRNLTMAETLSGAEVVHCHTWYTALAGLLVKHLHNARLVLTTHSLEPHRPWKAEQLGSGYQVSTWLEQTAYQNADGVIAVSRAMARDVHELYGVDPRKIRVIYNGIDIHHYRFTPDQKVLKKYGITPEEPYILFVGRISRQKGITHLLDAVASLHNPAQIVLCASDPDTPELGQETSAKVDHIRSASGRQLIWIQEFAPKDDLIALYSQAALFVCPSIYEPFGIINLEAMACGTPVVAAAVGGIREVVRHGETGLQVEFTPISAADPAPQDPQRFARDLAAAIDALLADPDRRRFMGERSREVVVEQFSWESIARQTLDFYHQLAGT